MSACCMPVWGRTVGCELFSIWMMIGAPDVAMRVLDRADGTCTIVVKLSFQSATARSCRLFVAVFGTSSVWVRLWVSVNASVALWPVLSQVRLFASTAVPSRTRGVLAASIGCEKLTLRLARRAIACWASALGASFDR